MNSYEKSCVIAEKVKSYGGRAFFVGGYVRDALIGNVESKDIDIEVYNVEPDKLKELLSTIDGKLSVVGESFQVYKLSWWNTDERYEIDISIPRKDVKIGDGHKGFEVTGNPYATFEDAASRRDFTINAIMQDILTNEIIDPFNGQSDIENKIINIVDVIHFAEDSLRVLRAAQFASRFGFKISDVTREVSHACNLKDLPKERIWTELEKLLLKSSNIKVGFDALYDLKIVEQLFPELAYSRDIISYNAMNYINRRENLDDDEKIICHLGIISSVLPDQFRDAFYESTGVISSGKKIIDESMKVSRHLLTPINFRREGVSNTTLRKLPFQVNPILICYITEAFGEHKTADWFRKKMSDLNVYYGPQPPYLLGRHLIEAGMEPGPDFTKYLDEAYEMQMQGKIKSLDEAKAWLNYVKKR